MDWREQVFRQGYLGLHPGMLYECPGICCEAAHCHTNVSIHFCDLLYA